MKKGQSSLLFKLVLLYAALVVVLGFGFGVDIAGWWAIPAYEGLSAIVNAIMGLFH